MNPVSLYLNLALSRTVGTLSQEPPILNRFLASIRCKPRLTEDGDYTMTIRHPPGRYPQLTRGNSGFQPPTYD
jgi:hypothetical protein